MFSTSICSTVQQCYRLLAYCKTSH